MQKAQFLDENFLWSGKVLKMVLIVIKRVLFAIRIKRKEHQCQTKVSLSRHKFKNVSSLYS